jgi:hypothetical protein
MGRRPLPVSSKQHELKMQKGQNPHGAKASEGSKWGTIREDLDKFSNDIASYASTSMTESVVTEASVYTAASSSAAPLDSDPVPDEERQATCTEKYHRHQLPNADTRSSEKFDSEVSRVQEREKELRVQERECDDLGNDGEIEDYFPDEEDYGYEEDYVYESLLDESEFSQGLTGYMEGFEPPVIHDISPAYSARRKFSDEQILSAIKEDENNISSRNDANNLTCANCGGQSDGCGGGKYCI